MIRIPTLALLIALFAVVACSPADEAAEAKSAYGAQQSDCVAKYTTREEIDGCRAQVRAAWGVDAGSKGGAK